MASQLFANWSVLTDLRIPRDRWTMESRDAPCKEYVEAVYRNVTRARVRLSLEQSRVQVGAGDLQSDSGGNVIAEPSDDEYPAAPNVFPGVGPDVEVGRKYHHSDI